MAPIARKPGRTRPGTCRRKQAAKQPAWRRYLEQLLPAAKNDPKNRVMKSVARKKAAIYEQPFRFLDLSPEIRNHVYEYCLIAPKRVILTLASEQAPRRGNSLPCVELIDARVRMVNARRSTIRPHILRTCHTINHEATSILYGMNHFRLGGGCLAYVHRCGHILSPPGGPIEHIRTLELGSRTKTGGAVHNILARLSNASSMEVLTVDYSWLQCFRTPETMAKAFTSLLRSLNRTKRDSGREEMGLDALVIKRPARNDEFQGIFAAGAKKDAVKFLPKFKQAMKRILVEQEAKKTRGKILRV